MIALASNPVNSWKWAGGGYISTTEEMAKFTWNILNSDFLRPDVLNLMLSPQELMDGNKTVTSDGQFEKNNQSDWDTLEAQLWNNICLLIRIRTHSFFDGQFI